VIVIVIVTLAPFLATDLRAGASPVDARRAS
jgi:hypothetical protein